MSSVHYAALAACLVSSCLHLDSFTLGIEPSSDALHRPSREDQEAIVAMLSDERPEMQINIDISGGGAVDLGQWAALAEGVGVD